MTVKKKQRSQVRAPAAPGTTGNTVVLERERAEFIQTRVSINLAARDADNRPVLSRALGCRVSPDGRQVIVFVSVARSQAVLRCVRANGVLAAVFTRPSTHETLQLKTTDAAPVPLVPGDIDRIAAYRESLVADLGQIGFSGEIARAVVSSVDDDFLGIQFTPNAAFVSTPGPNAGQRLRGGA